MKVLHLIPSFGPGGAERQLSVLAPGLVKAGVETHVGHCYGGSNLPLVQKQGVHLHQLDLSGNHDPRLIWRISRLIRSIKPNVVQTWLLQMDTLGGGAAILSRVPFILSERSSIQAYPQNWKTRLRVAAGRRAAYIVANSQGGADYWRSVAPNIQTRIIRNCITLKTDVSESEAALQSSLKERPFIMYAGRLSYEKNLQVLFKAFIQTLQNFQDVTALVFGEGPLEDELRRLVTGAGMTARILFLGFSRSLSSWMRLAKICISTSTFEGNPGVVLEAAASGCPLVLSDIPAHREIFSDESACFASPDSSEAFAEAMEWVLRNPDLASIKAGLAQKIVSSYSESEMVQRYLSIYKVVCNNH